MNLKRIIVLGAMALATSSVSYGNVTLCNKSPFKKLNVIVGKNVVDTPGKTITKGWLPINKGECKTIHQGPATEYSNAIYLHASSGFMGKDQKKKIAIYGGRFIFCAKRTKFEITLEKGATACPEGSSKIESWGFGIDQRFAQKPLVLSFGKPTKVIPLPTQQDQQEQDQDQDQQDQDTQVGNFSYLK